jgi:WS/DGAT/MGAT family acyltransferase
MRQLTSLDAQFLALESKRQTGHVGSVAVYDPASAPGARVTCRDVRGLIQQRLPLLPPLRWRIEEVPLSMDFPYWVEDDDFDISYHVRELALPAPGSHEQLAEQVARIMSRPLDRRRPLWEVYVIEGLEGGLTAVLTKIHHAVIDGMSGNEIVSVLLDRSPEGREIPSDTDVASPAGDAPGRLGMLVRGALGVPRYPLRLLKSLPSALPNMPDAPAVFGGIPGTRQVSRVAAEAEKIVGVDVAPAAEDLKPPKVPFSGRLSPHRRIAFATQSLDAVKEVKSAHGVTVNDVLVAVCAGAVRRWLLEHGALPETPLAVQIPVSVRTEADEGSYGNRILLMRAPLYTEEADPLQRLWRTHEALAQVKQRHPLLPAHLLQDANNFVPPALFNRAAQIIFRMSTSSAGRPAWNLVVSNVPGPQVPLYFAGARLLAIYPVSVITDGMGLNFTAMSYCGQVFYGVVADREQMPDLWSLVGWLDEALEELKA